MRYWLSGHQWVISGSLVTLLPTADYFWVSSCIETARFGVIVVVESKVNRSDDPEFDPAFSASV
jgi:hypothetical protein